MLIASKDRDRLKIEANSEPKLIASTKIGDGDNLGPKLVSRTN